MAPGAAENMTMALRQHKRDKAASAPMIHSGQAQAHCPHTPNTLWRRPLRIAQVFSCQVQRSPFDRYAQAAAA